MLAGYFTLQTVLGFFILTSIIYLVQLRLRTHWSIKRLGGYAPYLGGYLPFSKRSLTLMRVTHVLIIKQALTCEIRLFIFVGSRLLTASPLVCSGPSI